MNAATKGDMITCKLTGILGKPVKAHIIPESFYLIRPGHAGKMKLASSATGAHPKKCPIGVYDLTILTAEGEGKFSSWDDYAYKLLVERFSSARAICRDGTTYAYLYSECDYAVLKLFFISILWRAGVSGHPFFSKVKLGPHENRLRRAILNSDPGDAHFYSVALVVFDNAMDIPKMVDPFQTKLNGVNFYCFHLGNFVAYIKTDKRPTPRPYSDIQLSPSRPLLVVQRDFAGSRTQWILRMLRHARAAS